MDFNATGDTRTARQLTGSQQLIYGALLQKNQGLADLYEAALYIYSEERCPARLILAAHSFRELADGLPKSLDLPIPANPALITDHVNPLEPIWSDALKSECHRSGEWTGTIDAPLRKLLQRLHDFFEWLKANRPKRSAIAAEMFRKTDPSGLLLPEALEKLRVKSWQELRRYFSNTAHGESTTAEEFDLKVDALERILLDSLCRTPSEDLSEIDRILEEGVGDA